MIPTAVRQLLLLVLALFVAPTSVLAERRVALVIGNSAYKVGPLANPLKDAAAVAKAFEGLGFAKVILKTDLSGEGMKAALGEIAGEAQGAEIAVIYYAGHGTEREGRSYLIPVDAKLERASDLDLQALALPTVIDQLGGTTKLKLVILDACRNNVFPLAGSKRAVPRGLARIEPEDNTLVVYSAKEGTVAEDGSGREHSPFTEAFLKHITTPGLEIRFLLAEVRDDVVAATARKQTPHVYGTLGRERIYLKEGAPPAQPRAPQIAALAPPVAAPATPPPSPTPSAPPRCDGVLVKVGSGEQCIKVGSGKSFKDCPECPEMVVVPAGSFMMGSPESDLSGIRNEGPQHRVTITRPFAVGKFEVTFDEWDACVAAGGCKHNPGDEGWGRGRRPVINVSWDNVREYVTWLSLKSVMTYRLLSESEWEYAARAGTTTKYAFGDTTPNAQYSTIQTVEVGKFSPNSWGLHDMHGNVCEWVEDCWHSGYSGAPTDGAAWTKSCTDLRRVRRGGSWKNDWWALRSAARAASATVIPRLRRYRLSRSEDA